MQGTTMNIGIFGSGDVAKTLAGGFLKYGHSVMLGTRSPDKLMDWKNQHTGSSVGTFADTAAFADLAVLAVKGSIASEVLNQASEDNLTGKPVIDVTNPIADSSPENGVIKFFTNLDKSLMEQHQQEFKSVRFVKAFNSVGSASMVNPLFKDGKPTMFICGNDEEAKNLVHDILDQFGWETEDMGGVEAARAIEPLCMLWCIPGLLHNDWSHAFKLLR
jgi:hypothetical protein